MRLFNKFSLLGRSIRHKVMLSMVFCLLGLGSLGGMGYYYLTQIAFTLSLSGDMDELNDDVAEARRVERQYYKHGQQDDLAEITSLLDRAAEKLQIIIQRVEANSHMEVSRQDRLLLARLQNDLKTYHTFLLALPTVPPIKGDLATQAGWLAADKTRALLLKLRDDQSYMVSSLQRQLCWVGLGLLGLTLVGGWLVGRRILRALDIIEDATHRIAAGDFSPLTMASTEEETGQVIRAINRMVGELEKRQHKLEQERKLASMGVLTAGIAHQLNNPLNNIYSTCQLLHEGLQEAEAGLRPPPPLPEVEQRMGIVMQEIRRARNIIRGLLNFSRESTLNISPYPLSEVVRNALQLASPHLPAATQVSNSVPDSLVVPLDALRFQEACINVFINAGEALAARADKHTGPHPAELRIRAREEGDNVLLEIEDTGEGIDSEHICRIFDPFFTRKSSGTGLGLSVAFGIVRKHEGSISVQSTPDVGTIFSIRLPRRLGDMQGNQT